jgi:uncharacterized repeat protein (TIGR01451 family)
MKICHAVNSLLFRAIHFVRLGVFIALVGLLTVPLFSASSASSSRKGTGLGSLNSNSGNVSSPMFSETIQTFAADCVTPKNAFAVGETVCAKTDGVDLQFSGGRWVNWLRQDLSLAYGGNGFTNITINPQTFTFAPDAAGTWKVTIAEQGDISQTPAVFTVSSPPLATYDSTCASPQSSFSLGDTVCAKVEGVDPGLKRRLYWIDPDGNFRGATDITTDPQSAQFTLPGTETEVIGDSVVDNRGKWKVNIVSSRGSAVFSVLFNVAGATPTADLGVAKTIIGDSPDPGANFTFFIAVTNNGPSIAQNVVLTDPQPANASFVSIAQTSGPAFSCSGSNPVVCTIASLAVGETARFEVTYAAGSSGNITNTATVSSGTTELNPADNTASFGPFAINGGGGAGNTCSLSCPGNIVTTATSASGAVVNFDQGFEVSGDCGGFTTAPASGSVFPVGTTTVTATSSQGGSSCTFTVEVVNSPAPTITCPLPTLTVQAPAGQTETTVSVSTPSATGTCVTVTGSRDDDADVSDPYPVGTTLITWTATETLGGCPSGHPGRTASCSQIVKVTSNDAPTITCPVNKTFTTADCAYTATAAEVGAPATTGNGVTVEGLRGDHLSLTDPFPAGTTIIIWTATDNTGRTVSCSQTITVTSTGDHTPPTLTIPPDLNVITTSCSEVLDDELGVATATDNCSSVSIMRTGVPTVSCPIPGNPTRQCESFVFPTGTTNITYTAIDAAGNVTTGVQHVTVHEATSTPPTISAPAGFTVTTGPGATSCSAVVGDATLGTATANDNCPGVTVARTGVPAGNSFPVGNTVVTYTATDASGSTATATQTITVVDNTPPSVTPPAAATLNTGPGATSCSVTVSNLDAALGTGSASDNCPGVGAVTRTGVPAGNTFPLGTTTVTYSATDAHGNSSSATQVVTVVDNTPPVISCPANMIVNLPLNSTATSMAVSYPPATATDNCSGAITISYSVASGSVFSVGPTSVTATATDAHNNSASCTFTVTVLYNFAGFFSPVSNPPTVNVVNAGQAIPVKFSLSGNKGLDIFAAGSPSTVAINCDGSAPQADVTETVNAGTSSLSYSAGGDQYIYVWKTDSSWAGTCRQLRVTLNDGSVHTATFRFR